MNTDRYPDADVTIDASEIEGGPFDEIMAALDGLEPGEQLLLLNSFEPVPLYDVLDEHGFTFEATEVDGEWRILISHAD